MFPILFVFRAGPLFFNYCSHKRIGYFKRRISEQVLRFFSTSVRKDTLLRGMHRCNLGRTLPRLQIRLSKSTKSAQSSKYAFQNSQVHTANTEKTEILKNAATSSIKLGKWHFCEEMAFLKNVIIFFAPPEEH